MITAWLAARVGTAAAGWITKGLIWAAVAGVVITVALGWLKIHDSSVRAAARAEFNQQQLELVLKEQQALNERLDRLRIETQAVLVQREEDQRRINQNYQAIQEFLASQAAQQADRPSSEVLRRLIEMLQATQQGGTR